MYRKTPYLIVNIKLEDGKDIQVELFLGDDVDKIVDRVSKKESI